MELYSIVVDLSLLLEKFSVFENSLPFFNRIYNKRCQNRYTPIEYLAYCLGIRLRPGKASVAVLASHRPLLVLALLHQVLFLRTRCHEAVHKQLLILLPWRRRQAFGVSHATAVIIRRSKVLESTACWIWKLECLVCLLEAILLSEIQSLLNLGH